MSTGKVKTFITVISIMLVGNIIAAFVLKLWNKPNFVRTTDSELA